MVQEDRPQMTIQYGAEKMRIACRLTKTIKHRHMIRIFNSYRFSTAKKVHAKEYQCYVKCILVVLFISTPASQNWCRG